MFNGFCFTAANSDSACVGLGEGRIDVQISSLVYLLVSAVQQTIPKLCSLKQQSLINSQYCGPAIEAGLNWADVLLGSPGCTHTTEPRWQVTWRLVSLG